MTERRIRIGLLANSYVPGKGALSGGFIHILEVAQRWSEFDVAVFAPEEARVAVAQRLPAAEFNALPRSSAFSRLLANGGQREALRRCDVLVATTAFIADVWPTLNVRRRRSVTVVQHLQTPPWRRSGNWSSNLRAYVTERVGLQIASLHAGLFLVNDERDVARLGIDRKDVAVTRITHGVDHVRPYILEGAQRAKYDAVFVGRIHPTKGLDELIRIWRIVADRRPEAHLTLIGSGNAAFESHLRASIAGSALEENISLVGAVSEERKCSALATARVFVFPSLEEGWGIALAEAMSFGLPAVTYDLRAYRHVFTSGRASVAVHDVAAFARAILELFDDDVRWLEMSLEATQLARTFTWSRAAEIYSSAFQQLLSGPERSSPP